MTDYLQTQRHWLIVERLPGYAPDLNPVETLWGNVKGQELANHSAEDLTELDTAIHAGMIASVNPGRWLLLFSSMPVYLFDLFVTVLCDIL